MLGTPMELPHWLIVAGGILVIVGMLGVLINARKDTSKAVRFCEPFQGSLLLASCTCAS
jgi:hypothetical protein